MTNLFSQKNIFLLGRYGFVTISSYVILIVLTYIFVEIVQIPATPAYIASLTLVYIGVYMASSRFVFKSPHSTEQATRYLLAIIGLWILNSGVFYVLESVFDIYYLLSVVINIAVFGPFRFLLHRLWVYKENNTSD